MNNQVFNIINKAASAKSKYNILTFDTHERYQTQLAKTGHDFYAFRYEGCKEWDTNFAPKPSNYYTLPKESLFVGLQFDFILSQSKFGQMQAAQQIQNILKVPIVSLEHTLPIDSWPAGQLQAFQQMSGDINVFISDYSAKIWGIHPHRVIHHSVDSELFAPNNRTDEYNVLSVVNDFINRDYCCNYSGFQRITKDLAGVKVVGDTKGLSEPAESPEALAQEYNKALCFLNTSTVSPVPTALLEAMSCGVPVVSTATCMIPDIIQHGVNGFISNDETELRGYLEQLRSDAGLREEMGKNARTTILNQFSEDKFVSEWNTVFSQVYGISR